MNILKSKKYVTSLVDFTMLPPSIAHAYNCLVSQGQYKYTQVEQTG